jgi:putative ABC transport system substrate-binding protein
VTWCFSVEGAVISAIKSGAIAQYDTALEGFKKSVEGRNVLVVLNEYDLKDGNALEHIRSQEWDLILTLGTPASKVMSENIENIPVVFSVVLFPERNHIKGENVTGASLDIPVGIQLENLKAVVPDKKTIGVIYNPEENEDTMRKARQIVGGMGLILKTFPVKSTKEIPRIKEMGIDALWLIPDTVVSQPAIIGHILRSSLRYKVPVMGVSRSYAKAGALLALSCDYEDIGRQSGEMALRILSGEGPADIPVSIPRKVKLYLNLAVAERLKIKIPREIIENADEVFGK